MSRVMIVCRMTVSTFEEIIPGTASGNISKQLLRNFIQLGIVRDGGILLELRTVLLVLLVHSDVLVKISDDFKMAQPSVPTDLDINIHYSMFGPE